MLAVPVPSMFVHVIPPSTERKTWPTLPAELKAEMVAYTMSLLVGSNATHETWPVRGRANFSTVVEGGDTALSVSKRSVSGSTAIARSYHDWPAKPFDVATLRSMAVAPEGFDRMAVL